MAGKVDTNAATLDAGAPAPDFESASLLPDKVVLAARYEILGMLGAGAMGNVYRARDRDLDEIVALKVLKRELASSPLMIERFKREVKLARRVTHRNVARTFDIGEHEGDRFLTMEYVEGEMLGERLVREERLKPAKAIAIARELCHGLAAAHEAGVIHRDLKPENVIEARDGRIVITDFGIARAFDAELGRTAAGGLVGTPAYMAPEQVDGTVDLDARVDLYALGIILYELVTGRAPWEAPTVIALAAARLIHPPPDPRVHLPAMDSALAELILKLLARARDERFGSALETEHALASLASPEGTLVMPSAALPVVRGTRRAVAVMPLRNQAGNEDAYLAEALTEDLVDLLSVVPGLRVRGLGETASVASKMREPREVGRALSVDVVVDGSVRRIGPDVRITLRLLTVSDGFQLWAQRYLRPTASVLAAGDEAATAIANALVMDRDGPARGPQVDPIAEELYLRGRHGMTGWFGMREQVARLREALARAPDDARILGALAFALARYVSNEQPGPTDVADARTHAERALAIDPRQPEARSALGLLHLANNEGAAAIVELKRALANGPNNVYVLDSVGRLLGEVGRLRPAVDLLRHAIAVDPEATRPRFALARVGALAGEADLFLDRIGPIPKSMAELIPYFMGRARHALWYRDLDDVAVMRSLVPGLKMPKPQEALFVGYLGLVTGETGTEQLRRMIANEFDMERAPSPRRGAFNAQLVAEAMMGIGESEEAMRAVLVADRYALLDIVWLDRAPILAPLRPDPRFQAVRHATAMRAQRVLDAYDGAR